MNDTFALLGGKAFGRTQLWKLSPNKTIEGFIAGFLGTAAFGYILIKISELQCANFLLCPQNKFTMMPFEMLTCKTPYVFVVRDIYVTGLSSYFGTFRINEFTLHIFIFVIVTSLVAPFGGFFASGLKRALRIKDFSNIIPGHGGFTDRIDCIWVMIVFTYVYLSEIIKGKSHSLTSVLNYIESL